jgi:hypothetical protein
VGPGKELGSLDLRGVRPDAVAANQTARGVEGFCFDSTGTNVFISFRDYS